MNSGIILSDRFLIKRCKENDYSAQLKAYQIYKDMMYNVSHRIVQNQQDAEDIVQDAFIKGFKNSYFLSVLLKKCSIKTPRFK